MKLDQTYSVDTLPEVEPVPLGWYGATIVDAELKETKAGTGKYISLQLSIDGPTHSGRTVWANLNISNPSAKAEEIGLQQFGELLKAVGLERCGDTDQLVERSLEIKVAVVKSEQYGDKNEVKGYRAKEGASNQPAGEDPPAGGGNPPWKKAAPGDDEKLPF